MWYYFKGLSGYDFNPCDAEPGYTLSFSNSVAPDQLASKEVHTTYTIIA